MSCLIRMISVSALLALFALPSAPASAASDGESVAARFEANAAGLSAAPNNDAAASGLVAAVIDMELLRAYYPDLAPSDLAARRDAFLASMASWPLPAKARLVAAVTRVASTWDAVEVGGHHAAALAGAKIPEVRWGETKDALEGFPEVLVPYCETITIDHRKLFGALKSAGVSDGGKSGSSRRRGGSSRRGKAAAKKAPAPSGPLGAMALASAVSSGCNMASNAKSVTDKQLGKMGADLEAMEAAIQKKKLAHIDSKTKSACRYAGRVLAARPRDAAVMALFGRLDTVEAQAVKIAAQQLADYRMPKNLGSVKKHHAGIAKAVKKDLPDDPRKILQIRTPDDFKYVAPFNNERRLAAVIAFSVPGEKRKCHIVNYTLRQSRVSGNKWSTITYYSRGMAEFKILCKNVKK